MVGSIPDKDPGSWILRLGHYWPAASTVLVPIGTNQFVTDLLPIGATGHTVAGAAAAVASLAYVVMTFAAIVHNQYRLCRLDFDEKTSRVLDDPAAAVARNRRWLRLYHRTALILAVSFGVTGIAVVQALTEGQPMLVRVLVAVAGEAMIAAFLTLVVFVARVHRRLVPWCPWCDDPDDDPEVTPSPVPEPANHA